MVDCAGSRLWKTAIPPWAAVAAAMLLRAVGWGEEAVAGVPVLPQEQQGLWVQLWVHSAPQVARDSPQVVQASTPVARF